MLEKETERDRKERETNEKEPGRVKEAIGWKERKERSKGEKGEEEKGEEENEERKERNSERKRGKEER